MRREAKGSSEVEEATTTEEKAKEVVVSRNELLEASGIQKARETRKWIA